MRWTKGVGNWLSENRTQSPAIRLHFCLLFFIDVIHVCMPNNEKPMGRINTKRKKWMNTRQTQSREHRKNKHRKKKRGRRVVGVNLFIATITKIAFKCVPSNFVITILCIVAFRFSLGIFFFFFSAILNLSFSCRSVSSASFEYEIYMNCKQKKIIKCERAQRLNALP